MRTQSLRKVMMALIALLIATGFITTAPTAHAAQAETLLASKPDSGSSGANNWSRRAAISGNGRYVAFESYASNLTTTDGNGQTPDIFVRDLTTNHTVLVSVATDDTQYAAQSLMPAISYDGRYVAFVSQATLESPDTNGYNDIYVRDRDTDNDGIFDEPGAVSTTNVSKNSSGMQGNGPSYEPSISGDGRFVSFTSAATNLVTDTNGLDDIFVHDMQTGATVRASEKSDGTPANSISSVSSLSYDGRYVAFQSNALLVSEDNSWNSDIYVRDRDTDNNDTFDEPGYVSTSLISRNGSTLSNSSSEDPAISGDGRFVVYSSNATNLDAALTDTNGYTDVYLYDSSANTSIRISKSGSTQGNGNSDQPAISSDGVYVAFESHATNLYGDTTSVNDVYRYKRTDGTVQKASVGWNGNEGNWYSEEPTISGDGRYVAFKSSSNNLLATGDSAENGYTDDIFARDFGSLLATYSQPSWWNGDQCDSTWFNGHKPSGTTSATPLTTWRGITACGPINSSVAQISTSPIAGANEWQCTELARRYLYIGLGLEAVGGSGGAIATNYYNHDSNSSVLDHVTPNSTTHEVSSHDIGDFPEEGSVISYSYGTDGHVAIATHVEITDAAAGNATITIMEQNSSSSGVDTDTIYHWVYDAHSVFTVKDWITPK